jgi:hypothetical protein
MATRVASLTESNLTDALYRLWINEFHNTFIAFGWVQTADTGQINFTTATQAGQGFAIYRMNDALQGACPYYVKITFSNAPGSTSTASIGVQACIGGTNGSGTLTGNVGAVMGPNGSITMPNGSVAPCRSSGDSSSMRMNWWSTDLDAGWTLVIERDRDTSGNATSLGVCTCLGGCTHQGCALTSQFLGSNGEIGANDTRWHALVSAQSSQTGVGTTGVGPVRCTLGSFRNPMIGLLVFARGDFAMGSINPIMVYGAYHNYMMLRPNVSAACSLNTWNGDCGLAILWE